MEDQREGISNRKDQTKPPLQTPKQRYRTGMVGVQKKEESS